MIEVPQSVRIPKWSALKGEAFQITDYKWIFPFKSKDNHMQVAVLQHTYQGPLNFPFSSFLKSKSTPHG